MLNVMQRSGFPLLTKSHQLPLFWGSLQVFGTYLNTECRPKQPELHSLHNRGSLQHSPANTTRVSAATVRDMGQNITKHKVRNKAENNHIDALNIKCSAVFDLFWTGCCRTTSLKVLSPLHWSVLCHKLWQHCTDTAGRSSVWWTCQPSCLAWATNRWTKRVVFISIESNYI